MQVLLKKFKQKANRRIEIVENKEIMKEKGGEYTWENYCLKNGGCDR